MQRLLVCDQHATATLIEFGPGTDWIAIPPVEIICPQCVRMRREAAPSGTESLTIVRRLPDLDGASSSVRRAYAARLERDEAAGKVRPGSEAELEALDWIDSERPKAIWRDHNPRGRKRKRQYQPPPYRSGFEVA